MQILPKWQRVDPMTFRFIDGLILRTLNIDDPTLSSSAASVSPLSSVTPPSATVPSSPASVPSSPASSSASAAVPSSRASSPASAVVSSAPLRKEPVVSGTTYPDREPLVFFCDAPSSIKAWLAMGLSGAFQGSAEVEMSYYYMLPVEGGATLRRAGPLRSHLHRYRAVDAAPATAARLRSRKARPPGTL